MPISRSEVHEVLRRYDPSRVTIGVLASHSALDVLRGAKKLGFRTLAVARRGRDLAYRMFPVVDELMVLDDYRDLLREDVQEELRRRNVVFVPNRSFAVYVGYDGIENEFLVPMFGNRFLLRWEERVGEENYYRLLDEAGIPRPKVYERLEDAEGPVIVKLPEARRRVERAFFIARSGRDAIKKIKELMEKGIVDEESLKAMSIEEYVDGAHFNLNFFQSPVYGRLELHSIDRRLQTNIDDLNRLPAWVQAELEGAVEPRMIEIGHIPVTIRESMLHKVFELGLRFVEAAARLEPPGVIGPFTLQAIATPGLGLVVYDIAPRIGGGTNAVMAWGGQYSSLYFPEPLSLGERIAHEIHEALKRDGLEGLAELVT
ncbi:formate--phosphoribosylaminoimidazolecarboxamide ligase family protein [Pyrodictium delaneyi]|uniref:5-formaminoimidazole-4-carboxamide-1-(Beta)-D-ribofuranosyl 5'-monophosphate synthetase n=1 Tax=Pyrodictium delaneyi TaxID=1273541 RepID=A0A211YR87_9CREN|nr:formate--phosphoribosylaminoimidazolecarboxamide ligase family protein [Pyrodictium delaneyi]OWJ55565.1 5-formaminoimidazole-4-carboxamide-1-(beta)-D-ribofuranosyl 5'-monophosphate synthetase [Pyrodictium delaneyi]